ncbi:MAG: glycosyltransferase [Paludibacteraceae bacterium]|nr:glycosyltransferase [Paludibacteraceae bacterium]
MFLEKFLELDIATQVLAGIFLLSFVVQAFYYLYYYAGVIYYNRKLHRGDVKHRIKQPPVSVIICSKNEAENLEALLPTVLEQRYPEFQVVVVNDGSTDESTEVLDRYSKKYPNLYHTFLPIGAKYMSRKKMCITVAVKAAKYDHLLLIDADCRPDSDQWISEMVRNFTEKKELVIGVGAYAPKGGLLNKIICFDNLFNTMQYVGLALRRSPYMGTHRNIAYTKEAFLRNKGFISNLGEAFGEDDLFVQDVATKENTSVEIAANTVCYRDLNFKAFMLDKEQRMSTRSHYKFGIRMKLALDTLTRLLFLASGVALIIFLLNNPGCELFAAIAGGVIFLRYLMMSVIFHKAATILRERKSHVSFILLEILLPLLSAYLVTFGRIGTKKRSMWR